MQILQLTKKFPFPPRDGDAVATLALSEQFVTQGHQVDLLAMNTSKHHNSLEKTNAAEFSGIQVHTVDVATDLSPFKALVNLLFSQKAYIQQRFESEEYKAHLIQLLNTKTYDIVQLEGLYLLSYASIIRKHSKAKIAFRAHNIEYQIWSKIAENSSNRLKKYYLRNMARRLAKYEKKVTTQTDYIIPISDLDCDFFSSLSPRKPVYHCPAGMEIPTLRNKGQVDSELKYYHLGALDWMPNQEGIQWFLDEVWQNRLRVRPQELRFALVRDVFFAIW